MARHRTSGGKKSKKMRRKGRGRARSRASKKRHPMTYIGGMMRESNEVTTDNSQNTSLPTSPSSTTTNNYVGTFQIGKKFNKPGDESAEQYIVVHEPNNNNTTTDAVEQMIQKALVMSENNRLSYDILNRELRKNSLTFKVVVPQGKSHENIIQWATDNVDNVADNETIKKLSSNTTMATSVIKFDAEQKKPITVGPYKVYLFQQLPENKIVQTSFTI